jgi:hypothetical protein
MLDGKQLKDASIPKGKLSLVDATGNTDPVTLQQMNAAIAAARSLMAWKEPARVAVTTNVNTASPGAALDGVTMAVNDRVLLVGQTTASQNGPWVWNGAAVAMTRPTDFDVSTESISGSTIHIQEGTSADVLYKLTTNAPITLGTTSLTWALVVPASGSATPTRSNKFMAAVATVADGDVACNTALASSPTNGGFIRVFVNADNPEVGDGVKTKACYFSGDAGVTARAWSAIVTGDKLYWNGSIAGYQLATTDLVSFDYSV